MELCGKRKLIIFSQSKKENEITQTRQEFLDRNF